MTTGTPEIRANNVKNNVMTKAEDMDRSRGWVKTTTGRLVTPPFLCSFTWLLTLSWEDRLKILEDSEVTRVWGWFIKKIIFWSLVLLEEEAPSTSELRCRRLFRCFLAMGLPCRVKLVLRFEDSPDMLDMPASSCFLLRKHDTNLLVIADNEREDDEELEPLEEEDEHEDKLEDDEQEEWRRSSWRCCLWHDDLHLFPPEVEVAIKALVSKTVVVTVVVAAVVVASSSPVIPNAMSRLSQDRDIDVRLSQNDTESRRYM